MAKVGQLSQLHRKYYSKGLRVLGISSEPAAHLRATMIKGLKAKYWIGSDPEDRTGQKFLTGGAGIPQFYVVDSRGVVVAQGGMPTEALIKKLLAAVFPLKLGRKLHRALAKVDAAYANEAYGAAWKNAQRYLSHKDPAVVADAKFVRTKIEKLLAHRHKSLQEELPNLQAAQQYGEVLLLKHQFAGFRNGDWKKWVAQQSKRLRLQAIVKAERADWAKFELLLKQEIASFSSAFNRKQAKKRYEQFLVKHQGCAAADVVSQRLRKM